MCQDAMEEVEYYVLLGNTWIEMFCKCSFKSDIAKKDHLFFTFKPFGRYSCPTSNISHVNNHISIPFFRSDA